MTFFGHVGKSLDKKGKVEHTHRQSQGKHTFKIDLNQLRKVWTWTFGKLMHQINYFWKVLMLKLNFLKKVVSGKTALFKIGLFFTPHSIFLNIGFKQGSFVGKQGTFSSITFSWKTVPQFFKKDFRFFKKNLFQSKALKMFKIFSDCLIKTYLALRFRETYGLSIGFKIKPLRRSVFLC